MCFQLMEGATIDEIKAAGLESNYTEHGFALFPSDSNGVPFTTAYVGITGDPIADLAENMAADATYS